MIIAMGAVFVIFFASCFITGILLYVHVSAMPIVQLNLCKKSKFLSLLSRVLLIAGLAGIVFSLLR